MLLPLLVLLLAFVLRLTALDLVQFDGDEAFIQGLARSAIEQGHMPLASIPSSLGLSNAPLPVWLAMLPIVVSPEPMLVATLWAMLDVVAVALCYRIGRDIAGPTAGVWATLAYACAFWVILFARRSKGEALMPFFAAMSFLLWLRLPERPRLLPMAGFSTSLLLQTHWGALTFVPTALVGLALARRSIKRGQLALMSAAFLLPWFPYALWQLQTNFVEIRQALSLVQSPATTDLQPFRYLWIYTSASNFAPFLGLRSGSPMHEPPWASLVGDIWHVLLLFGGAVGLSRLALGFRSRTLSRTGQQYLMLFIWLVAPLLLFSRHSLPVFVHYILAITPAAFIVIGLGCQMLWRWWQSRQLVLRTAGGMLLVMSLAPVLYSAFMVSRFQEWLAVGGVSDLHGLPYRQLRIAAEEAKALTGPSDEIILSTHADDIRPLSYLLQGHRLRHSDLETLLLPEAGSPTYIVWSGQSAAGTALSSQVPSAEYVPYPGGGDGLLVAHLSLEHLRVLRGEWEPLVWPWQTEALQFVIEAETRRLQPEGTLTANIVWRVLSQPESAIDQGFFIYLENDGRQNVAAHTVSGVVASEWRPGDMIVSRHALTLPELPAGRFWLRVGLYDPSTNERLPLTDATGRPVPDDAVRAGPLKVSPQAPTRLISLPRRLQPATVYEGKIALVGASIEEGVLRLQWRAIAPLSEDLTRFAHLIDGEGRLHWQSDSYPRDGAYPTSIWDEAEVVEEQLTFPSELAIDSLWRLALGWYRQPTLNRLLRTDGPVDQPADRIEVPLNELNTP